MISFWFKYLNISKRKFCKLITNPYYEEFYNIDSLINNKRKYLSELETALSFPHQHLEKLFYLYEENSESFPAFQTKKMFDKNVILYRNLKNAFEEDCDEKWFELLQQTKDYDYVIQNMEYYIAEKPWKKNAWKLYIGFLKIKDSKAMLGLYSRYCRFFFDDIEMKEKYQEELITFQQSIEGEYLTNYIIDLIDIVSDNFMESCAMEVAVISLQKLSGNIFDYINIMQIFTFKFKNLHNYQTEMKSLVQIHKWQTWFMKENLRFMKVFDTLIFMENSVSHEQYINDLVETNVSKNCLIKWNSTGIKDQNFAFHDSMIWYIAKNNYSCRKKLYQTCKIFYSKFQSPLAYNLIVHPNEDEITHYSNNSLTLSSGFLDKYYENYNMAEKEIINVLNNITLTTELYIADFSSKNCFVTILKLPKLIAIKYLTLSSQDLTIKDIKLLHHRCELISCRLYEVDIYNSDEKFSTVEDVITVLNTVKILEISCKNLVFTKNTSKMLLSLPKETQFDEFNLCYATSEMNPIEFGQFLTNFAAPNCKFCVYFPVDDDDDFYNYIEEFLCTWNPKLDAPVLSFTLLSKSRFLRDL